MLEDGGFFHGTSEQAEEIPLPQTGARHFWRKDFPVEITSVASREASLDTNADGRIASAIIS